MDPRLRGHMPALDGVRGLAILMVLLLHFVGDTPPKGGLERVVMRLCEFGGLGVDLFFVLSGFLITGILIEAKGSEGYFRNFYMRRALRIFPLYYGVLFVVFVVAPHVPVFSSANLDTLVGRQAWAWLYGINIFTGIHGRYGFPYIDHFWSLAVEEHFYFVWPLVVWLCSRELLVRVSLAVALASLVGRMAAAAAGVDPLALYVMTPFRLDALCLGGFLAAYARGPSGLDGLARAMWPVVIATLGLFAGLLGASHFLGSALFQTLHQFRATLFVVLLGAVVVGATTAPTGTRTARFFQSRQLGFLGKYSYGLYVFHHFFSYYFMQHQTDVALARVVSSHTLAVLLQTCLGIAASVCMALLSYSFYEKPFLSLKRFWPARGEARAAEPRPIATGTGA